MKRLLLFPVLLLFACLLAGLYGALHNQISYSVSPGYFHEFKFIQFHIPPELQNRIGASLVGVLASWWMGVVIGVPLFVIAVLIPDLSKFIRAYLIAASIVVGVTLVTGLGALIVGTLTFGPEDLPVWMKDRAITDPVAFARAGNMHNFSYLGGVFGLICAAIYLILVIIRLRTAARRVG